VTAPRAGRPFLTVMIPAYNEERRLPGSLARVAAYTEKAGLTEEILVVDDGSTDATFRIAADFLKGRRGRVLRNGENRGKGYSVRRGVLEATGRWVLLTDADLSAPIEEHAALAEACARTTSTWRSAPRDQGLPCRDPPEPRAGAHGEDVQQDHPADDRPHVPDTQCGFKLMDRDRVRPLFEKMVVDRFAFDVEFLYLCKRFSLEVGRCRCSGGTRPARR